MNNFLDFWRRPPKELFKAITDNLLEEGKCRKRYIVRMHSRQNKHARIAITADDGIAHLRRQDRHHRNMSKLIRSCPKAQVGILTF